MLDHRQLSSFEENGFLVVQDVVNEPTLEAVRREYADLMDELYRRWFAQGLVKAAPEGLSFWDKLGQCYQGDFDWYQPFDISLPHGDIREDTPMHIGPAVFDLVTHPKILDDVDQYGLKTVNLLTARRRGTLKEDAAEG